MALSIKNREIIGKIDELEDKLEGKLPVDKLELLYLVNSWGRHYKFYISGVNNMEIEQCETKECYDLSKLDTSKITNMDYIFKYSLFIGDINLWDVSNVTSMNEMFDYAKNFNQPLNNWNTSKVIDMKGMFRNSIFNQDISQWDVSNVSTMNEMFSYARYFNQNINSWDVSNVIDMSYMFHKAREFNQPLNQWKTSNIINMIGMFRNSIFNQDISQWDVSNATNMGFMFTEAKVFNQNISNWNLNKVNFCDYMFDNAEAFLDKYNSSKPLSSYTDEIKKWFNNNREKMNMIDTKNIYGKEIDDFFSKIQDENSIYKNNFNLLTECNKPSNRMQQAICL